jgi:hypothetical protein
LFHAREACVCSGSPLDPHRGVPARTEGAAHLPGRCGKECPSQRVPGFVPAGQLQLPVRSARWAWSAPRPIGIPHAWGARMFGE